MSDELDEPAADAAGSGDAAAADADVADAEAADQQPDDGGKRRRNPFLLGAIVLVIVAFAAAGVFGGLWANAALGGKAHYSQVRDHVLQVARGAAVNFTSVDYRDMTQYKKHAEQSTTGALHKSLDKSLGQYSKKLSKAQLVVKGTPLQAAMSSLDTHSGKASALVVMKAVTQQKGQKPSSRRIPMTINLTKVDSGDWKVSGLGGNSGSSPLPGK